MKPDIVLLIALALLAALAGVVLFGFAQLIIGVAVGISETLNPLGK